ncbi:hypothetical protein [Alloactinosynnema sp. L-07]|nr:hypothetical protein [Alloactinosynnema sp. L-07]
MSDLLLRLAEADTYRLLWSEQVLQEVERNLPKVTADKARKRVDAMRAAFPDAMVTGYEPLINGMTNHPKDRHVLAAAVRANTEVIVTANLKDFPAEALTPYDIDAVHPDDFLMDQLDLYPEQTVTCVLEMLADCNHPPITAESFMARFSGVAPGFVAEVRTPLLQADWSAHRGRPRPV